MKSFTLIITALFSSLVSAGDIVFCDGRDCTGSCSGQSPGSEGLGCRELGGINSAKVNSVDDGCSFTVYTDSTCSSNPTTAGLGQCVAAVDGYTLASYSYDC